MKILFVHDLAEPDLGGGAEVIVWEQLRGLRNAGHECVLLTTSNKHGLERTEHEGITIWKAGIRNVYWHFEKQKPNALKRFLWHGINIYNPWMQGFVREVVGREKPDVASVHCWNGWSAAVIVTLANLNVPTVQILHAYEYICIKATMYRRGCNCQKQCLSCKLFRIPHKAISQKLQAVVGVSQFILDRHRSLGYFRDVPIQRAIHNARDPIFLRLNEADLSVKEFSTGLRFGYIGRLDQAKGVEVLINAFRLANLPGAHLYIAGAGKQQYEQALVKNVNDQNIHFIGRVAPSVFYPMVDVVVVPSLWNDNLPGVVFEALAFGRPVIGSRRGGIPEMINEGMNGLLFDPDKDGELVVVMSRIFHDERLRSRLTQAASESALPFINLDVWIDRYQSMYYEVIENYKNNS